ncbi:glycogen debranching N-terminal domain-containing protein [Roseomonas sp. CCTCC AB2023176]|uniref:amylo-alpha-1,6-glucosidase n=1 Tax=Roseomonas sp. CCTCC AB2023176 TaxID=3342640 RepID=UPI0035E2C282
MDEEGSSDREDGAWNIAATSANTLYRPRTLKNGPSFLVLDHLGDAQAFGPTAEGLFHDDTRFLSRLALRVGGARPLLLSSAVSADNALLTVNLTNPELPDAARTRRDTIHLERQVVLGAGLMRERLTLRNFGNAPIAFDVTLSLGADFADIFEVRGQRRARRGERLPPRATEDGVVFAYRGLDGVERRTFARFDPMPADEPGRDNRWPLTLTPGEERRIEVAIACESGPEPGPAPAAFDPLLAGIRAWARRREGEHASVTSSNPAFDAWFARSQADLTMLTTETEQGPLPYGGIPWFSCPIGRHSIVAALLCLWSDPALAAGVLRFHAAHQATAMDPSRDAEPGKILHERRRGEMAALREVPFGLYYGSVDTTPLFVMLAASYAERTGDLALIRGIWPNIVAALNWIERHGDGDGDLLVEYDRRSANGLIQQGWKDSWDSVFHEDGSPAEGEIALIEVQAYAEAAWRGAARLARALGQEGQADLWSDRAEETRARIEEAFWDETLGTYAMALDGAKRPCRVRSSNPGHALFTGLPSPDRAARIAGTLMSSQGFGGWGVRTVAAGQARYNPMSYHVGSIWPHDNALIALGLKRYGLHAPLEALLGGLYASALAMEDKRLPELFCGFPRRDGEPPTTYPVACIPQAWAAAAAHASLGAMLGVAFRPEEREIRFVRPILPPWLDELRVGNLRLGEASAEVLLRRGRGEGGVTVRVLRRTGPLEVAVIA